MAKPKIKKYSVAKSGTAKLSPHFRTASGILKVIKKHSGTVKSKTGIAESFNLKVEPTHKGIVLVHGPGGELVEISDTILSSAGFKSALRPAGTPCPHCNGTGRI